MRFLIGKQTLLDTKDYSPMVLQRYPKKSVGSLLMVAFGVMPVFGR